MSEITFSCPKCQMAIVCDDSYVGSRIDCPGCSAKMTVPNLEPQTPSTTSTSLPRVTGPSFRGSSRKQGMSSELKIAIALGLTLVVSVLIAWSISSSMQLTVESSKLRIVTGMTVIIAGFIALIGTALIVCANAFRESFWWGIGSFIPFIWWRYARKHWEQNKRFAWANMGAATVIFCGFGVMGETSIHWDSEEGFSFNESGKVMRANLAPDETVTMVLNGVADGNVGVAWEALPAIYQNDINTLIHDYADAIDPNVWDRSVNLAKRVTNVLRNKKNYIFNTPMFINMEEKADTMKQFDQALLLINAGLSSDLFDLKKLKTIDVGEYLNGNGAKLVRTAMTFSGGDKDSNSASLSDLKNTIVTVANNNGNMATLDITFPGQSKERFDWVRIDDRWVPKALADEWPAMMAESRQAIAMMKDQPEMSALQANMMFGIAESMLTQFEQANSQEEFDEALGGFAMMSPAFEAMPQRSRALPPQVEDRVLASQRERAMAGQRTAQYDLGMRYANGDGVAQDDAKAKYWLTLSAQQDYSRAKKALAALELRLRSQLESEARIAARLESK